MRTSKFAVFIRSCIVVFCIYLPLSWMFNKMVGEHYFTMTDMAISAVVSVIFYGGFAWLFTNIGMRMIYGNDPQYQAFKRNGGDPFIDSLPRLFTGKGQSKPSQQIKGPEHWKFSCPRCDSKVEHQIGTCWNCNYGADGDSTLYLQQNGKEKPSEMNDSEWEEIIRRHNVGIKVAAKSLKQISRLRIYDT